MIPCDRNYQILFWLRISQGIFVFHNESMVLKGKRSGAQNASDLNVNDNLAGTGGLPFVSIRFHLLEMHLRRW